MANKTQDKYKWRPNWSIDSAEEEKHLSGVFVRSGTVAIAISAILILHIMDFPKIKAIDAFGDYVFQRDSAYQSFLLVDNNPCVIKLRKLKGDNFKYVNLGEIVDWCKKDLSSPATKPSGTKPTEKSD